MLNLDATGKESNSSNSDRRRTNQGRRDSVTAMQKQNEEYGLDGEESALREDNAGSASSSSSKNTHITPVLRRQKRNNLSTEQRQHRSASMYDTRLSELLEMELWGLEEEDEKDGGGKEEEEEEEEEEDEEDDGHKGKARASSHEPRVVGLKPQVDPVRPRVDPLRQIDFFRIFDFEEEDDEDFSSENDESGGSGSLSAEHRRQARLSLTEFLADPRNFDGTSENQQSSKLAQKENPTYLASCFEVEQKNKTNRLMKV
eukprot:XP_011669278.1 PREDICTED: ribosomal biogenesis protein LAS1L-like isoform X1 [Strongylocentrotus purpuratus]